MSGRVNRVTMFRCPDKEQQKKLLALYDDLAKDQSKDGKPYILELNAGIAEEDPRTGGFHIISRTTFASMEDMKFYDDECPAHMALKKGAAALGLKEKPLTVYFYGEPQFVLST